MAESVKVPFLCVHNSVIWVQLPPTVHMLLHPWIRCLTMIIISAGGFELAAN